MRRAIHVLLLAATSMTLWAQMQSSAPTAEASASAYLLRLERAENLQSVCVLLNVNGQYHLERHSLHKVRVFEGTLDAEELRGIIRTVSGDLLVNLEQKQIPDLMLKSDSEQVSLEVHRPGTWQQLVFPDSASREPFREAMDPLLKWLDAVNKRKATELSEEAGRNNCLPPATTKFAQRQITAPAQPEADAARTAQVPPAPANYILQAFNKHKVNFQVEVTCVLVYTNGLFHLVKQTQTYPKGMRSAVLDGTIAPPALASLRALLDAPELVNHPEEKEEKQEFILPSDGYLIHLAIPRGSTVQRVTAWRSYRLTHTMSPGVEERGKKLLAPLREWFKLNVDDKNARPAVILPNPRCLPGG